MTSSITAHERARRAHIVSLARLGVEIEGWRSSEQTRALQDAYVRGELDLDDLVTHSQCATASPW
jgi:hypothetical protein